MYAIIATGGKQYKVAEGDEIRVEKLGKDEGAKVVFDQVGTPTYALDLANAIQTVVEDYKAQDSNLHSSSYAHSGIYHFSNEGVCSWYDFAKMIAEYHGQSLSDIQPCYSSEFPSPVKRPAYSVLDKTKIKKTFGVKIPYWTDSLKKCINNLKKTEL